MKTHVQHGREILGRSPWLQDALNVVLFHHEKLAGKGYPQGIEGEEIPVTARIFAIADVFDALTSKRPYKAAFTFEQAMKILEEGRGTQFDPPSSTRFAHRRGRCTTASRGRRACPGRSSTGFSGNGSATRWTLPAFESGSARRGYRRLRKALTTMATTETR